MPIIRIGRRKIQSCSSWILVLLLGFGYLESARAGSASDAFSDRLNSVSGDDPNLLFAVGDYFGDWFKRVDEHWPYNRTGSRLSLRPHHSSPNYTNTINIGSIFLTVPEI
jgi:hypothetical protein